MNLRTKTASSGFHEKIFSCTAIFLGLGVFYLLLKRLFYGVDFADEAFYCALAKVFAQGRRPFVDELISVQSFAITLIPITKLFLRFSDHAEGIVIFFRFTYFLLLSVTCFVAFKKLRRQIYWPEALVTSLILWSFWPFSIPSLSYNTLGGLFTNLGILTLFFEEDRNAIDWLFPVSLLLFGLSSFCYPTLAIPISFTIIYFLTLFRSAKWTRGAIAGTSILALSSIALIAYLFFFYSTPSRFELILAYTKSYGVQGGGSEKFSKIFEQFVGHLPFVCLVAGGIWLCVYVAKRNIFWGFTIGLALMTGIFRFPGRGLVTIPGHMSILALSLTGLPFAFKHSSKFSKFWPQVGLIGCVFGFVFAWQSSNGLTNFAVGSSISVLGFGCYLVSELMGDGAKGRYLSLFILTGLLMFQVRTLYHHVYGDTSNLELLNARIESGPFKFLWTGQKKVEFSNQLTEDLIESEKHARSVAFFESFAAGYLFTDLRVLSPAIWAYSLSQFRYNRNIILQFFEDPNNHPDTIYWLNRIPLDDWTDPVLDNDLPDPVKDFRNTHYSLKTTRKYYSIYERNDLRQPLH